MKKHHQKPPEVSSKLFQSTLYELISFVILLNSFYFSATLFREALKTKKSK